MAVRSSSAAAKRRATPGVIAIAVVVLIAIVGWLAYANMLAPPKPLPLSKQAQTNHDWIKSLAQKSGGDFSKLSPEEQQKLTSMTGGYGAMALKATLNER